MPGEAGYTHAERGGILTRRQLVGTAIEPLGSTGGIGEQGIIVGILVSGENARGRMNSAGARMSGESIGGLLSINVG